MRELLDHYFAALKDVHAAFGSHAGVLSGLAVQDLTTKRWFLAEGGGLTHAVWGNEPFEESGVRAGKVVAERVFAGDKAYAGGGRFLDTHFSAGGFSMFVTAPPRGPLSPRSLTIFDESLRCADGAIIAAYADAWMAPREAASA